MQGGGEETRIPIFEINHREAATTENNLGGNRKGAHQAEQSGNSSLHQQEVLERTLEDCSSCFSKLSRALEGIQPIGKKSISTRLGGLFSDKIKVDVKIKEFTSIFVDDIDALARYHLLAYTGITDLYTVI
jgi:hypothetical protein